MEIHYDNSRCVLMETENSRFYNCKICPHFDECSRKTLEENVKEISEKIEQIAITKEKVKKTPVKRKKKENMSSRIKKLEHELSILKRAESRRRNEFYKKKYKEQAIKNNKLKKVLETIAKPKRELLKPKEKDEKTVIESPITAFQNTLIKTLEKDGPLSRKQLSIKLTKARTTIYDNLLKLQKKRIIEKFTISDGKRGAPVVYWSIKEEKEITR